MLMPPLHPTLNRLKANSPHRKDSLKSNKPKESLPKMDLPQRKPNAPNGKQLMIAPKKPGNFHETIRFLFIIRTAERLVVE